MPVRLGCYVRIILACGLALVLLKSLLPTPGRAQSSDDDFRIYAVNVVKTPPFKAQFTGYGIYLGKGIVLTAAHVVGHWPMITHPRVLAAGQDLVADIIKQGTFETTDLALLSVDETKLPVSLRLRRNPLCQGRPQVGMEVVNVIPQSTTRARVISPLAIAPELRTRFSTIIDTVENSGSGLFDPQRRCLMGIMSAKMQKYRRVLVNGHIRLIVDGYAGYFVAADRIANFIPSYLHF